MWEPRGQWQNKEVADLCNELKLLHSVDPFKAGCLTPGLRYYRLHGIAGYRHRYSDKQLRQLTRSRAKAAPTYFLFNNVSMLHDAARFKKMLR
ncbi:MAG: DUF72 domain-containing protein [Planctomycetota bacterium]